MRSHQDLYGPTMHTTPDLSGDHNKPVVRALAEKLHTILLSRNENRVAWRCAAGSLQHGSVVGERAASWRKPFVIVVDLHGWEHGSGE
jgi:hypothetical protein